MGINKGFMKRWSFVDEGRTLLHSSGLEVWIKEYQKDGKKCANLRGDTTTYDKAKSHELEVTKAPEIHIGARMTRLYHEAWMVYRRNEKKYLGTGRV